MKGFLLPRHDPDFNHFETSLLQPSMQIAFRKSQPAVSIQLMRLLERMPRQIQDDYLPVPFQSPVSRLNRLPRFLGVVESLTQNRQIDALRFQGWVLQVS